MSMLMVSNSFGRGFPAVIAPAFLPLFISLTGAGRVGFYVDYSELTDSGSHVFYVSRTHGTAGVVSVDYATFGDSHTQVSGTLTWGSGDASIKSFVVPVTATGQGEHRIYAQLSNPTGGAVLHFGSETKAYGVLDDDSVAPDNNAIFYDSAASGGGDGTASAPYNNIKTAINAINGTTRRYLYGRGTTVVDDSFDSAAIYSTESYCIIAPATRSGESDRLIIRNWPGYTWRVTGAAGRTDVMAFIDKNNGQFHTYRGLQIDNLDSNDGSPSAGIWYHYGDHLGCTFEYLNIFEIDGNENQAGISFYGATGEGGSYSQCAKFWRCSINNIRRFGSNVGSSAGSGILSYDGNNISVQRCTFSSMNAGVYMKRMSDTGHVSPSVRFCIFDAVECDFGESGAGNASHSYTIVQSNIFKGANGAGSATDSLTHHTSNTPAKQGEEQWWCNNTFYRCGASSNGAIILKTTPTPSVFNNIFHQCRWAFVMLDDYSSDGIQMKFYDFNHIYSFGFKPYNWRGADYNTSALLNAASGVLDYALNESESGADTLFSDAENGDFTLAGASPCVGSGFGGVDKGAHWDGFMVIGA